MSQLKLSVHALLLFLAVSMFAVAAEKSVSPVENYAFCSEDSLDYPSGELTITYRVEDADGNLLDKYTEVALLGQVISKVPDKVKRQAYTTYSIPEPVKISNVDKVVRIVAAWNLPFELSKDLKNAHWYNLALRNGADYVTVENGYKCNVKTTKDDAVKDAYQWAFTGNPYTGIVVYNRTDTTKTLAKVNDKAILSSKIYAWKIVEGTNGFLLANNEDGKYINEYGGEGGYLGFWSSKSEIGSMFQTSKVGAMTIRYLELSSGASLKLFRSSAEKSNGRAILIIPGGGYSSIAGSNEGASWAPFFNELGYTAALLTYTTPPTAHDAPMKQALDAMDYLRRNVEECNTSTGQIGVIGFSAGGHLASTVATHASAAERPAFQILFYPVITMDASYTHKGSRNNLIGKNPPPALVKLYSNEKQVTKDTPMAYICWADDDGVVPPLNSINYTKALEENGVSVHTKNFPTGGHGYGFKTSYTYHKQIVQDLTEWMLNVDNVLTDIKTPVEQVVESDVYYNLYGHPVSAPQRGIYIKNGRKIFVK